MFGNGLRLVDCQKNKVNKHTNNHYISVKISIDRLKPAYFLALNEEPNIPDLHQQPRRNKPAPQETSSDNPELASRTTTKTRCGQAVKFPSRFIDQVFKYQLVI